MRLIPFTVHFFWSSDRVTTLSPCKYESTKTWKKNIWISITTIQICKIDFVCIYWIGLTFCFSFPFYIFYHKNLFSIFHAFTYKYLTQIYFSPHLWFQNLQHDSMPLLYSMLSYFDFIGSGFVTTLQDLKR